VVDDHPDQSSFLAASLGRALAERGEETLLLDGVKRSPRVPFLLEGPALGDSVCDEPLFQAAPRLKCFLPPFNLTELGNLGAGLRTAVFDSISRNRYLPRFIVFRTSFGEAAALGGRRPLDMIFLIPSDDNAGEPLLCRRIKPLILEGHPGKMGAVITGTSSRAKAYHIWERLYVGMSRTLGVSADFLGYLPDLRESDLSSGGEFQKGFGKEIAAKLLKEDKKRRISPYRSLEDFLMEIDGLLQRETAASGGTTLVS
jgi:hypothetical protein